MISYGDEQDALKRYLDNLTEDAKEQVIEFLYFQGEVGRKTIKSMVADFGKMYASMNQMDEDEK